jgi:hypothetical protein
MLLKSHCPERKKKEVQLKTMVINAMIDAQAV